MEGANKTIRVINADGLILGRMASIIAKRLLLGEEIVVVNAERAVISGKRVSKVHEKKEFLKVGGPRVGPFHYKQPDRIVRKTVRGMLPYKQPKGKQAYKRLKVFIGVPDEFKSYNIETLPEAQANKLTCPYLTVGDLAKEIGWSTGE
ncbi:MAG: 50S ribosomal protein L13 [Candidatus Bathyarchaeia archaeon]